MSGSSRHSSVRPPATGGAAEAERVADLMEPVLRAVGMDLEGVRITAAGRRRLLRVVVDADGGVSLDDIAVVSRELSAELDASSVMGSQPYTLEVSSPGVDRPLTRRRHWRRAIGRLVRAPLATPDGDPGQAAVEGRITGASADAITLDVGGQIRQFGYGDLGPGKIQVEFARIGADLQDAAPEDLAADDAAPEDPALEGPAPEDPDPEDPALEGPALKDAGEDESADEEGSDGY